MPNKQIKKGFLSFVFFESPFTSISKVTRGHPCPLVSLIIIVINGKNRRGTWRQRFAEPRLMWSNSRRFLWQSAEVSLCVFFGKVCQIFLHTLGLLSYPYCKMQWEKGERQDQDPIVHPFFHSLRTFMRNIKAFLLWFRFSSEFEKGKKFTPCGIVEVKKRQIPKAFKYWATGCLERFSGKNLGTVSV